VNDYPHANADYDTRAKQLRSGANEPVTWALHVDPQLTQQVPRILLPNEFGWLNEVASVPAGERRVSITWHSAAPGRPSVQAPFVWRADITIMDPHGTSTVALLGVFATVSDANWLMLVHESRALLLDVDNGTGEFESDFEGVALRGLDPSGLSALESMVRWLHTRGDM
jgi:hypothetical protein